MASEVDVGSEWQAKEDPVDFNVYSDDTGLDNPRLDRKMLKAIILSKDWEMTKIRCLDDIYTSIYPSTLKVKYFSLFVSFCCGLWLTLVNVLQFIHDISLIKESIASFTNLSRGLRDQLEVVRAEKEVAKELEQTLEGKLEKCLAANLSMEKDLKLAQNKVAELEAKLKKKKKKLYSSELLIKESLQKSDEALARRTTAEKRAELAEKKAELVEEWAHRAVEEFKGSSAFEDEMIEAGVESYKTGFVDCLEKISKLYPNLDVSKMNIDDINKEDDKEDEVAEQDEDVLPKVVDQTGEAWVVADLVPAFEVPEQIEDRLWCSLFPFFGLFFV